MYVAQQERQELCALFDRVGPDAPTLSGNWTTRDLAAHLIVREGRPDTVPGMVVPVFSRYTQHVQDRVARRDWTDMVRTIRTGPPIYSPMRPSAVDKRVNALEFYVHHEDVRRAQPDWEQRPADPERYRVIEQFLMGPGKLLMRRSPVSVRFDPQTGKSFSVRDAGGDAGVVTVVGSADELALFAYGRDDQARVEFVGDDADITALRSTKRGL
ncbi:TIGR03085 family protein [Epidermidibacterium keratini]|uniref:TIGR03085 family protein n=1 Tax=Epidermidibacterium keratini TaxID=1891644 RepID=A0A7L4YSM6_9ACTN|nr:TIGR03085 family metal-binding protein [Epidermidibacterium keratini]QHC01904.1 TIGR03085 family protein [Epidermidibacterium keratini]